MSDAFDGLISDPPVIVPDKPPVSTGTNKQAIARLAKLDPIGYDQQRLAEAKRLEIRPATLDKMVKQERGEGDDDEMFPTIEPAADPVNGAELLSEIAAVFRRYLVLPAGAAETCALWVLHAHTFDTGPISPTLCITSPMAGCGKSILVDILGLLVPRPLPSSNITSAAVFRAVEKWRPTLLLDEADSFATVNEELRGILNSSHRRSNAFVIRVVGEGANMAPARFSTWCAKAIALIGKLPPTLESRSIHVRMRKLAPGETVPPFDGQKVDFSLIRSRCARWAEDHDSALRQHEPGMPPGLFARMADNWRPLIGIADLCGADWPTTARTIAETAAARASDDTAQVMLLTDIRDTFHQRGVDRIWSVDLIAALVALEGRPWSDWSKGRPMTQRQLGKQLDPFEIDPDDVRIGALVKKGYMLAQFDDAFLRYLPDDPLHRYNPQGTAENRAFRSATQKPPVADQMVGKPAENRHCSGVADRKPPEGASAPSAGAKPVPETVEDYFALPPHLDRRKGAVASPASEKSRVLVAGPRPATAESPFPEPPWRRRADDDGLGSYLDIRSA